VGSGEACDSSRALSGVNQLVEKNERTFFRASKNR